MKHHWKIVAAVVGLALAAFAIYRSVSRLTAGPRLPEWALDMAESKIDMETLERKTLKNREWLKLGSRGGKFKNPKTGKYTMVPIIVCDHCGQAIPFPMVKDPKEVARLGPQRESEFWAEVARDYVCPRCGKHTRIFFDSGPPMKPIPEENP